MALTCPLCDHTEEVQLVTHIKTAHVGGLGVFLEVFPETPIVSPKLFSAIENVSRFDYAMPMEGLDDISGEDRALILKNAKDHMLQRSEILVKEEF